MPTVVLVLKTITLTTNFYMYTIRASLVHHQGENQIAAGLISTLGYTSSRNV